MFLKTYCRNRSKTRKTCRLCLKFSNNVFPIFNKDSNDILDIICNSIHLQVSENDNLPSFICNKCHEFLQSFHDFKLVCYESDKYLRRCLFTTNETSSVIDLDCKDTDNALLENIPEIYCADSLLEENEQECVRTGHKFFQKRDNQKEVINDWQEDDQNVYQVEYTETQMVKINFDPTSKTCNLCNKTFASKQSLLRHQLVHTGEKNFECSICKKFFRQSCLLKRHLLIHNGAKPWKCSTCGKEFNQRSNWKSHEQIHLTVKSKEYACSVCQKIFNFPSGLSRHMLLHKGIRYVCDICGSNFSDRSCLQRHKKSHKHL